MYKTIPSLMFAISICFILAGCKGNNTKSSIASNKAATPKLISEVDLKSYKPDEAGALMIIMYHRIEASKPNSPMNCTPDQFRKDLQTLYDQNYRPVNVSDIVEDHMDVPAGTTPVAITFDDSWGSQFKVIIGQDGKPHIDPNCAVGIMETFSKQHPDWKTKATFFVLPEEGPFPAPFYQPEYAADKLETLLKHGYEIGNHTTTHPITMRNLTAAQVSWQICQSIRDITRLAPDVKMQCLAIPYGNVPRNKQADKALISGKDGNTEYTNKAVLLAAWRPIMSPITKPGKSAMRTGQIAAYNPYRLERVLPDPSEANKPGTLEFWLKFFKEFPQLRYISDGNPDVVAVPNSMKSLVDEARVRSEGKVLQFYSRSGSSSGGASGGALNVE